MLRYVFNAEYDQCGSCRSSSIVAITLIRTLLPGQMLDVRHLKTRRDLLRSDAALPGKVEQIRELFRACRTIVLMVSSPPALRSVFRPV